MEGEALAAVALGCVEAAARGAAAEGGGRHVVAAAVAAACRCASGREARSAPPATSARAP